MRWSSLGFAGDGKLCSFNAGGIIACGFGFMMLATGIQSGFWSSHMFTFVICESHWVCAHASHCFLHHIPEYPVCWWCQLLKLPPPDITAVATFVHECQIVASCLRMSQSSSLWSCLSATKILSISFLYVLEHHLHILSIRSTCSWFLEACPTHNKWHWHFNLREHPWHNEAFQISLKLSAVCLVKAWTISKSGIMLETAYHSMTSWTLAIWGITLGPTCPDHTPQLPTNHDCLEAT